MNINQMSSTLGVVHSRSRSRWHRLRSELGEGHHMTVQFFSIYPIQTVRYYNKVLTLARKMKFSKSVHDFAINKYMTSFMLE